MTGRDCVRTKLPGGNRCSERHSAQNDARRVASDRHGTGRKQRPVQAVGAASTPVGGQIVAEVLVGLIDGDGQSYRAQRPESTPTYGSNDTFTMVHLLTTAGVIAPLP
jgi:hypothetical protein